MIAAFDGLDFLIVALVFLAVVTYFTERRP